MAAALPYIGTALSAYSVVQAGKKPDAPKPIDAGDPESLLKKRSNQREIQRKYGGSGRAGTVLSGSSTLG